MGGGVVDVAMHRHVHAFHHQSWVHGKWMAVIEPASVALGTSRGHETELSKLTMRWTVLASDVLVFFPAALALARLAPVTSGRPSKELTVLVDLLLSPALILIDHGHFQYNCINLGLAVRW